MNVCKSVGLQKPKADIGPYTIKFLQFFGKNYKELIHNATNDFIDKKEYLNHLYNVRFLHTENLNEELYNFLLEMGYRQKKVQFILQSPPENTTKGKKKNWKNYYTPELKKEIRTKERLIFDLFPEYDV